MGPGPAPGHPEARHLICVAQWGRPHLCPWAAVSSIQCPVLLCSNPQCLPSYRPRLRSRSFLSMVPFHGAHGKLQTILWNP